MTLNSAFDHFLPRSCKSDTVVGVVTGRHSSAPKPTEFGSAGSYWNHEGWYLPVRFTELRSPIRPKDNMELRAPTLPDK